MQGFQCMCALELHEGCSICFCGRRKLFCGTHGTCDRALLSPTGFLVEAKDCVALRSNLKCVLDVPFPGNIFLILINSDYDADLNILDLDAPCLTSTQKTSINGPKRHEKSFNGDLPLELTSSPDIHAANECSHATIHHVSAWEGVLLRLLGHCGPLRPMSFPPVGCPDLSQMLTLQVSWNLILCMSTQSLISVSWACSQESMDRSAALEW